MEHTVQIFLPICVEFKYDVFFNVIKNSYGKLRLASHVLDNAVKSAMSGEIFVIKSEDLTVNWLQRESIDDQIRQAKLLGYWASINFPGLGKKFFGASWRPPQRNALDIHGEEAKKTAEEIDAIVKKKLKLRLVEVDVIADILPKLRHFLVDVPNGLQKQYDSRLSPKAKSFKIDEGFSEICWNVLRQGGQNSKPISGSKRQAHMGSSNNPTIGSESLPAPKRIFVEHTHIPATSESSNSISTERVRLETITTNDNDPIRSVLLEIRSEVGDLSEFVRSTFTASQSGDRRNSAQQLLIKQKDEAIAKLEAENELLKGETSALKGENHRQTALIYALQKGIESTSKLQTQAEQESSDNLQLVEEVRQEKARLQSENFIELQKLRDEVAALADRNQKLQNELNSDEDKSNEIEYLKRQMATFRENSEKELSVNVQLIEKVRYENAQLESANLVELQKLRDEVAALADRNQKLQNELNIDEDKSNEIEYLKRQMATFRENSEKELSVNVQLIEKVRYENAQLESANLVELQKLRDEVAALADRNQKLQNELNSDEDKSNEIEYLKRQMATFRENSEKELSVNVQLIEKVRYENAQLESANLVELQKLRDEVAALRQENMKLQNKNKDFGDRNQKLQDELKSNGDKSNEIERQMAIFREDSERELSFNVQLVKKLRDEVDALTQQNNRGEKSSEIEALEHQLTQLKIENEQLLKKNVELKTKLETLNDETENVVAELKSTIHDIVLSSPKYQDKANVDKASVKTQTETLFEVSATPAEFADANPISVIVKERSQQLNILSGQGSSGITSLQIVQKAFHERSSQTEFWSDDDVVMACRPVLLSLRFGWMTFASTKNAKFYPGFIHPQDDDGTSRAQKITAEGYVTDKKFEVFEIMENAAEERKDKKSMTALKKFNRKFHFSQE